jgi:hypothetical protein
MIITPSELKAQYGSMLAAVALEALRAEGFVSERGMCQKFVRQCVQHVYGQKFNAYHQGDAESSRRAWLSSRYAINPREGSKIGDILYKRASSYSPHGHVGIRIAGNLVAENSTVHSGGFGGRGTRSIVEFGEIATIVRLPLP